MSMNKKRFSLRGEGFNSVLASLISILIGLLAGIVVDISYGFIDPRIRMGEK